MRGSGGKSGDEATVLVFEYVTGGGLAGRDLPPSLAIEGAAIRRAIAGDFAAVPGVRVRMTLDDRFPIESIPGVEVRPVARGGMVMFDSMTAEADYTALIAPETDGILVGLTRTVERRGNPALGSGSRAILDVTDKAWLAEHLNARGIPAPPTVTVGPGPLGLPSGWGGPIVIKPRVGAGAVDTSVILDGRCPDWVVRPYQAVAQPYLPGVPMSASVLVDRERRATLLAIGRQRIEVDEGGRISYRGGIIPEGIDPCPPEVEAALASVIAPWTIPRLRGFVGVDFLRHEGRATILEINPRPTTSYVGLARLLPPGTVAGAWLAAARGGLAGTEWPDRLRVARGHPPVAFGADGTIEDQGHTP